MDDTHATPQSVPPDDPDEWTSEQWIAWLNETDADALAFAVREHIEPPKEPEGA